ncbi:LPS export ABC transporter ATP-binding protein [Rhizobiaceae sp. 2RAB30]
MPLLRVEGLGIDFGGLRAVNDVGFQVDPGEIVSVIGPNGAGKTTLFNMISGAYRPARGTVVLNGETVTGMEPHLLARRGLSRTFQNLQIFQRMTVLENVMAGCHLKERGSFLADLLSLPASRRRTAETRATAMQLLARVGLDRAADKEASSLSYGALKRLEIARALASKPHYMLLDEPFAGIDPIAVADIQQLVRHLTARGIGVLITDHNVLETLGLIDRAYIIHAGEVLTHGHPSDIVANADVRRLYLGEAFTL